MTRPYGPFFQALLSSGSNPITNSPSAASVASPDFVGLSQSGTDKHATMSALASFMAPFLTAAGVTLGAPTVLGNRIFQRDVRTGNPTGFTTTFNKGYGAASFTLTASAAGTVPVQMRLRDAGNPGTLSAGVLTGGTIVQDWMQIAASVTVGSNIFTPNLPASAGLYVVDFRLGGYDPGIVTASASVGVGEVVAGSGQSLGTGMFVLGQGDASTAMGGVTAPTNGFEFAPSMGGSATVWTTPAAGTTYCSAFAAELLRLMTLTTGVPAAFVGHAVNATSITTWQPGQGNYTALRGVLDQVGKIGAFIWIQGHADSINGMAGATYQGYMNTLFADLTAHYTGPGGTAGGFARLICSIPALAQAQGTNAAEEVIRAASQAYVATDSQAVYVSNLDPTLGDNIHPNQAGRITEARTFYRAWGGAIGVIPVKPGPKITGATRLSTSNVIKLAIAQGNGGTGLVAVGTPVNQFTVFPAGTSTTPITINSLSIISATEIDLTLAQTDNDATAYDVWYRYPLDTSAIISSGIYDNATDVGIDGITTGRQLQLVSSAISCASPASNSAPGVPTIVATPTTPTQITVAITANGTGGTPATYAVQRATDSGFTANLTTLAATLSYTGSPMNYQDNTVVTGTTYFYRVTATNTFGGPSAQSAGSSATTTAAPSISVSTPADGVAAAVNMALSGSYTGTVPTGVNYKADAGTYAAVASFAVNTTSLTWSGTGTYPAAGSGHTLTVQEANSTGTTGTAPGTFTTTAAPLTLPFTSGLLAQWDATNAATVTQSAGTVTAVADSLGGTNTGLALVSGGVAPAYITSGSTQFNGKNVIQGDGTSLSLLRTAVGATWISQLKGGPVSFLLVFKYEQTGAGGQGFPFSVSYSSQGSSQNSLHIERSTLKLARFSSASFSPVLPWGSESDTTLYKVVGTVDVTNKVMTFTVNGGATVSTSAWSDDLSTGSAWDYVSVGGALIAGSSLLKGYWAELVLANTLWTPTQVSQMGAYATSKYG